MSVISEERFAYLAEQGLLFGAETKNSALANDSSIFIQIEATTKPLTFIFGANVEALAWVESFIGTTLTTPTTLTAYNYKPSSTFTPTAVIRTASAASVAGTQRGNNQVGSGNAGTSVGGSTSTRPTTLAIGEKLTLKLTNKGGTAKCLSVGVYWTEVID